MDHTEVEAARERELLELEAGELAMEALTEGRLLEEAAGAPSGGEDPFDFSREYNGGRTSLDDGLDTEDVPF